MGSMSIFSYYFIAGVLDSILVIPTDTCKFNARARKIKELQVIYITGLIICTRDVINRIGPTCPFIASHVVLTATAYDLLLILL